MKGLDLGLVVWELGFGGWRDKGERGGGDPEEREAGLLTDSAVAATCNGIGEESDGEGESVLNGTAVAGAMKNLVLHGLVSDQVVLLGWMSLSTKVA